MPLFLSRLFLLGWGFCFACASQAKTAPKIDEILRPEAIVPASRQLTVLYFASLDCPTSNAYHGRLQGLMKYRSPGLELFAVYSHGEDAPNDVKEHAKKHGWIPVLDSSQWLVERYEVERFGTVVALDRQNRVLYKGPVDDNKTVERVQNKYVEDLLRNFDPEGIKPTAENIPVKGCLIPRRIFSSTKQVTFNKDVAPILNRHCVQCHRPGQAAPFSLLNYKSAKRWAAPIKESVQDHRMPPWKPANRGVFRNERGLNREEIGILEAWVDSGAKEGDSADLPPTPKFPSEWYLGEPDLILQPSDGYTVTSEGEDEYRCFVLDPKLTEDKFIAAADYKPGEPSVVHHVITYIDRTGLMSTLKDFLSKGLGYSSRGTGPGFLPSGDLDGWAMGSIPALLDDGTARLLPKGSRAVMEVHYHKSGREVVDRTRLGLYFAKKPVNHIVETHSIYDFSLRIPAGDPNYSFKTSWTVPEDINLISSTPHMHLLGKSIEVIAKFPNGENESLISIPEWDFNWQEAYRRKVPLKLPRGTEVEVNCTFDNSGGKVPVGFGEQTTDEMCVAYLVYTKDKP